ncbi:MAG: class I SAM-dependent methyltransferase [bacterium]
MRSSIIIDNKAAREAKAGELWFPAASVVGRRPKLPGIARLLDRRRRFVALAFLSPDSPHYLRVISLQDSTVDFAFWRERFERALARRKRLFDVTDAYRVLFGESDGIPSVIVDRYADVVSFEIGCSGALSIRKEIIKIIEELLSPRAIVENSDAVVKGEEARTVVREGDQRFEVDALSGQKTGAYLDYRPMRFAARDLARGDCLDAFCYQGWFSCHIAGFAKSVIAVDSSQPALDAAAKNAAMNGHNNIELVRADAFEYLKGCKRKFDFIHLDPPAMAKRRQDIAAAIRKYEKAVSDSLTALKPNGILMISACSQKITQRMIEQVFESASKGSGRPHEIVWQGIQDIDHPTLRGHSESLYLKAGAARFA